MSFTKEELEAIKNGEKTKESILKRRCYTLTHLMEYCEVDDKKMIDFLQVSAVKWGRIRNSPHDEPTFDNVIDMAKALGVDAVWLITNYRIGFEVITISEMTDLEANRGQYAAA